MNFEAFFMDFWRRPVVWWQRLLYCGQQTVQKRLFPVVAPWR